MGRGKGGRGGEGGRGKDDLHPKLFLGPGGLSPAVSTISTYTAAVHQYVLAGQDACINKYLTYRRETALPCGLVLAKSERLGLRDNILQI